jgi:lysophospholipase L1-like esterase
MTGALAEQWFSPDLIDFNNDTIREIAKERGIEFIDLRSNAPTAGLTVDGVHPNAKGYQSWSAAMTRGVQSAVDCSVVGIR